MYEYLKLAGAFTMGLGVGILASKRFFQCKYEKIAEEEIASVKAIYSAKGINGHIIESTSLNDPEKFEEKIANENNTVMHSSIDNMYDFQTYRTNVYAESEHPEDDRAEEPFEITEEEFSETELGFDKIILNYYIEDDILANAENGDIDLGQTIGDEGINKVRIGNCIEYFFRNPNYAVDYNVIRIPGSYYID